MVVKFILLILPILNFIFYKMEITKLYMENYLMICWLSRCFFRWKMNFIHKVKISKDKKRTKNKFIDDIMIFIIMFIYKIH